MAVEERHILHINDLPENIEDGQLCFTPTNDPDLGFRVLAYRDHGGSYYRCLAKSQPAIVQNIRSWEYLELGNSGQVKLSFDTAQTRDSLKIAVDSSARNLLVCDIADDSTNLAPPSRNDPTLTIAATGATSADSKRGTLSWKHLTMGQFVTLDNSAGETIAISNDDSQELSITGGGCSDLIVAGNADISNSNGLMCLSTSAIGWGSLVGHVNTGVILGLIAGGGVVADGNFPLIAGNTINVDGDYVSARGNELDCGYDYADVRGQYAVAFWEGARFTARDRHHSVSGNCQRVCNWVLVTETIGDETAVLRPTYSGSDHTFTLPDGFRMFIRITVLSSVYAATPSVYNNWQDRESHFVIWNCNGYHGSDAGAESPVLLSSKGGPAWAALASCQGIGTPGGGEFNLRITTSNTSGETITHVAVVEGVISQTSMTATS
jgi:hypothetical protein